VDPQQRETIEAAVRTASEAGDHATATQRALDAYGPELLRYLVSLTHDAALADEAFSILCEHLWRGLPGFRWEASLRTWSYVLARNALRMIRRRPHHRRPVVALSEADAAVGAMVAQLRSTTAIYLKTEIKDAVAGLRRQLDPLDQDILLLRIGRRMSWLDIARVMHEPSEDPVDDEALKREAARLRKRFQRSKTALEQLIREHGLKNHET